MGRDLDSSHRDQPELQADEIADEVQAEVFEMFVGAVENVPIGAIEIELGLGGQFAVGGRAEDRVELDVV